MSQHKFSEIPTISIPRSSFRRPFNLKTTIGTDYLYPIYVDEALPGDTFKFKGSIFGRLSTPVVPIMDNLYLDTFFFAVPIRLLDSNFRRVLGERLFGDQPSADFVTPILNSGSGVAVGSLSDYLGIPTGVGNLKFCSYWHRAYNLIWNEWFRAETLQAPVKVGGIAEDGTVSNEALSDYTLLKRAKRHDYFTSALTSPQLGDPVGIALANSAPLSYVDNSDPARLNIFNEANYTHAGNLYVGSTPGGGNSRDFHIDGAAGPYAHLSFLPVQLQKIHADLSSASSVYINDLRRAFAIQRMLEIDARGGTRLIELIKAHFSVDSPDARMQRPEYLGGFSQIMTCTSVPQTSGTTEVSPQGNLSAYVTVGEDVHWIKSFTEHCVILGLANIRADLSYQQGLPRMFSRRTRFDFYWPSLANLGEQAILNKEIYAQGTSDDNDVFGYQERWAEYRYHPNMITGKFRSTASGSLDVWHLAQKFESLPQLNSTFIEENVPITRVLAVQDEPPFILDAYFDVNCARPMPLYSVPSIGRNL